jgi:hypothetical protein
MPIVLNQDLYDNVKKEATAIYKKPSAYKSGWIVKTYKERGGKYADDNKPKNLERWFKEDWADIGGKEYPVYRPTKRITKDTPLTASEIDPEQAKEQIKLKQVIRGDANLPQFQGGNIEAVKAPYSNPIWKVSNPKIAQKKLNTYIGNKTPLFLSNRKDKKYMILDPDGKRVHFGNINYEDFLKHQSLQRRSSYISRATNIRGDWKNNKYSPNNLAIHVLW